MKRLLLACAPLVLLTACLAGCGSGGSEANAETVQALQKSASQYRTYLDRNGAKLNHWADTIALKIDEGSWSKAGSRYAAARVPYGHLAPTAQLFEPLNKRISGLESEVPPSEFGGFHDIEKTIFWEEGTEDMKPVARQLRKDIEELNRRIASRNLQPAEVLAGANTVLEGVLTNEVWGIAEPFAHIDFTDIAAKVEGVEAAFKAARPAIAESDPDLVRRIEAQLKAVYEKVEAWGTLAREPEQARDREPGISFVVYDQVPQKDRWELAQPIKALAATLSQAIEELPDS
jgi:iron uptake system component EfeO